MTTPTLAINLLTADAEQLELLLKYNEEEQEKARQQLKSAQDRQFDLQRQKRLILAAKQELRVLPEEETPNGYNESTG